MHPRKPQADSGHRSNISHPSFAEPEVEDGLMSFLTGIKRMRLGLMGNAEELPPQQQPEDDEDSDGLEELDEPGQRATEIELPALRETLDSCFALTSEQVSGCKVCAAGLGMAMHVCRRVSLEKHTTPVEENESEASSTDDEDDFRYCQGDSSTDDDEGYGSTQEEEAEADKIRRWQSSAVIQQPPSTSPSQKPAPPPAPSLTVRDLLQEQALHKSEAQLEEWLSTLKREENGIETTRALLAVDRADLVGCSAVLKAAITRIQGAGAGAGNHGASPGTQRVLPRRQHRHRPAGGGLAGAPQTQEALRPPPGGVA